MLKTKNHDLVSVKNVAMLGVILEIARTVTKEVADESVFSKLSEDRLDDLIVSSIWKEITNKMENANAS